MTHKKQPAKKIIFAAMSAAIILAAIIMSASCKQQNSVKEAERVKVTLQKNSGGNVEVSPVLPADGMVKKGSLIEFKATPDSNFSVDRWSITGGSFEAGTGTAGNAIAKVKANANITVSVSFKNNGGGGTFAGLEGVWKTVSLQLDKKDSAENFPRTDAGKKIDIYAYCLGNKIYAAIEVSESSSDVKNGFYRLDFDLGGIRLNHSVEYTFAGDILTLKGLEKHRIKVTLSGNTLTAEPEKSEKNPLFAKLVMEKVSMPEGKKIIDAIEYPIEYKKVPYADLNEYLAKKASPTRINYIEITGDIPAADFKGGFDRPGMLGKKIKEAKDKKVALKLPQTAAGITDMTSCFFECKNLLSVLNLPESLEKMDLCFYGCEALNQAPVIPANVKSMNICFHTCFSLTKAPVIPENVESMQSAFFRCSALIEAPVIPENVKNIGLCFYQCSKITTVTINCNYNEKFKNLFVECDSLEKGGIKVKEAYYPAYTASEALENMKVPGGSDEEKREKFGKIS